MTKTKDTTVFEMKLQEFHSTEDPMLTMIEWIASKGAHEEARTAYRSGYRTRKFNTCLGTLYMLVPKVRKGGYMSFLRSG